MDTHSNNISSYTTSEVNDLHFDLRKKQQQYDQLVEKITSLQLKLDKAEQQIFKCMAEERLLKAAIAEQNQALAVDLATEKNTLK